MSVQDDVQLFRQAMLAGAREFLTKPFSGQELIQSIRRVYEHSDRPEVGRPSAAVSVAAPAIPIKNGRIVSVFSPKGGVGRTTMAVNLALALRRSTDATVAVVDGSLQFGDVGILLGLQPNKTIVDLLPHVSTLEAEIFDDLLLRHESGVRVLLAPARPEMAELITPEIFKRILTKLKEAYDYVVVDTFPSFHEMMLSTLDVSDQVLVLFQSEMPSIKNTRNLLDVTRALGYPKEKMLLVMNRADGAGGIKPGDVEKTLGQSIGAYVPSDYRLVTSSLNVGVPFVVAHPDSKVSQSIFRLAAQVSQVSEAEARQKAGGILVGLRDNLPFRRKAATRLA